MEKACSNCKHYQRFYGSHSCSMAEKCRGKKNRPISDFEYNKWESKEGSMSDDKNVVWLKLDAVKTTKGRGKCDDCEVGKILEGCDCYPHLVEVFTGVNCEGGYIFKKPEKWVQCTRENTKVGDEVRNLLSKKITIEHVFEFSHSQGNCVINDGKYSVVSNFGNYEINLNR